MQFSNRVAVYSAKDEFEVVGYYGSRFVEPLIRSGRAVITEMKTTKTAAKGKRNLVMGVRLVNPTRKPSFEELAVTKGSFGIEKVHSNGFVYFQHQQQLYDGLAA